MDTRPLFATFYSFKGGVGRTLSLVNTAFSLVNKGYSVIVWDMDIEAPGIQNIPYLKPLSQKISGGVVDIVHDFRETGAKKLDDESVARYIVPWDETHKLRFLFAGNIEDQSGYSQKFSAIGWESLLGKGRKAGYRLFEMIRKALVSFHPDFVLIDSRTGFTDIGGICCMQLPDVVFFVFNYGEQNLKGTRIVYNSLANENMVRRIRPDRPLKTYRIASMVPLDRADMRDKRKKKWREENLPPNIEIPYNSQTAFEETIWTAEYPDHDQAGKYEDIAKILIEEKESLEQREINLKKAGEEQLFFRNGFSDAFAKQKKGETFEHKTAALFRLMGYEVVVDKLMAGSQIDIFITKKDLLDTSHFIVECKNWANNIDKKIVDEVENNLKAVKIEYPLCRAIIVAKKGFTKEAKEYADRLGIAIKTYAELQDGLINFEKYIYFLKTLYAGTELEKNYIEQDVVMENHDQVVPLLDYIENTWLEQPRGGFFTLLGDYGTGKTSFTRRLSYDMAVMYDKNRDTAKVPVLINIQQVSRALSLENIIFDHFSKTGGMNVHPETFLHLLREGKILLIFDGFDEMATQTNAALTMKNFMELNKAFSGSAKIVLTCRTHYFKDKAETEGTLTAKKNHLSESATDLYRAIQGKQGYSIGYLQEFKPAQIDAYLKKTLPDTWQEAKKIIDNIYNLKDLAARPVLLDMIVKSLPEIRKKGGIIHAADLYAAYVQSWLDREDWRHVLTREGRELLVEEIARRIWENDTPRVHYSQLNDILQGYLKETNQVVSANDVEFASSEVRTASFLTRDDGGNYGFAHRSFMEYFLAKRIARQLHQENINCLQTRRISKEVVLFLSQIMDHDNLIKSATHILEKKYQKKISENALMILYWTIRYRHTGPDGKIQNKIALKKHFTQIRVKKINLTGAALDRADISYMDLSSALLDHAGLSSAICRETGFRNASFTHGDLSFAVFDNADFSGAELSHTVCHHATFRGATLIQTDFTEADLHSCNFMQANMAEAVFRKADLSFAGLLRVKGFSKQDNMKLTGTGMPETDVHSLHLVIQRGHLSWVGAVSFSPDGKMIASGGTDRTVRLWDAVTGRELRALSRHSSWIRSVAYSPDGKQIATGSSDKTIKLWDVATGREINNLVGHSGWVNAIMYSPDGKYIVSGSSDRSVKVWDTETGGELHTLTGHSSIVFSVDYNPDGSQVVSGSDDNTLKIWDAVTGREVRSLTGHSGHVNTLSYSPDAKQIASGSSDKTIKLWDVATGREIRTLTGHSGHVMSLAYSPDGKKIASGSDDKTVKLWEVDTGRELCTFIGHLFLITTVKYSPDGRHVLSGSTDKTIKMWSTHTGQELRTLTGYSGGVFSVIYSPDGKQIVSGSDDKTIKIWDASSGLGLQTLTGHSTTVFSVSYNPADAEVASGSGDKTVRVWNLATGREIQILTGHSDIVRTLTYSPDGKLIASGGRDNTIKIWDPATGRELRTLNGHKGTVTSIVFCQDGKQIVSGSDDHTLRIWDVIKGQELLTLSNHSNGVISVTCSPDGKQIASASFDKTINIWDTTTGNVLRTLIGHSSGVISVAYSPDGRQIVSGSDDGIIKLWDITTGKELLSLTEFSSVHSVAFSPSEPKIIAGTSQGVMIISLQKKGRQKNGMTPLAMLYHLPDNEWAAIGEDNRFACSEGGRKFISFSDNLANYPAAALPELESPEGLPL